MLSSKIPFWDFVFFLLVQCRLFPLLNKTICLYFHWTVAITSFIIYLFFSFFHAQYCLPFLCSRTKIGRFSCLSSTVLLWLTRQVQLFSFLLYATKEKGFLWSRWNWKYNCLPSFDARTIVFPNEEKRWYWLPSLKGNNVPVHLCTKTARFFPMQYIDRSDFYNQTHLLDWKLEHGIINFVNTGTWYQW